MENDIKQATELTKDAMFKRDSGKLFAEKLAQLVQDMQFQQGYSILNVEGYDSYVMTIPEVSIMLTKKYMSDNAIVLPERA